MQPMSAQGHWRHALLWYPAFGVAFVVVTGAIAGVLEHEPTLLAGALLAAFLSNFLWLDNSEELRGRQRAMGVVAGGTLAAVGCAAVLALLRAL